MKLHNVLIFFHCLSKNSALTGQTVITLPDCEERILSWLPLLVVFHGKGTNEVGVLDYKLLQLRMGISYHVNVGDQYTKTQIPMFLTLLQQTWKETVRKVESFGVSSSAAELLISSCQCFSDANTLPRVNSIKNLVLAQSLLRLRCCFPIQLQLRKIKSQQQPCDDHFRQLFAFNKSIPFLRFHVVERRVDVFLRNNKGLETNYRS